MSGNDTDPTIEFMPQRHAVQRINASLRREMVRAQNAAIDREFSSALGFCSEVTGQLGLALALPEALGDHPASSVADLSYSDLLRFYTEIVQSTGIPPEAHSSHAGILARRSQMVRAFASPDEVLQWATNKAVEIVETLPKTAEDIEVGDNKGDVLDPYILAANQSLLYNGNFTEAVAATVAHKALMKLEGLLGHLHEEVLGRMRGNLKNPESRGGNAEILDPNDNPFPGADIIQPPADENSKLRLHQVKSKTGSMNSSGGERLARQMATLRMRYPGVELYAHSIVGNTLSGHRSMGGMLRIEPSIIVLVGDASFKALTGSQNGSELLMRVYQESFRLAAEQTGYSISAATGAIVEKFRERADEEGEGFLEALLHSVTRGDPVYQDSRTYPRRQRDMG